MLREIIIYGKRQSSNCWLGLVRKACKHTWILPLPSVGRAKKQHTCEALHNHAPNFCVLLSYWIHSVHGQYWYETGHEWLDSLYVLKTPAHFQSTEQCIGSIVWDLVLIEATECQLDEQGQFNLYKAHGKAGHGVWTPNIILLQIMGSNYKVLT